jgi:hypothetical protein
MASGDQTWLYRQGDLILGPVPTNALIDKLFEGDVNRRSEVQVMGSGVFRRIEQVPELSVHLAKAEAKLRVDAQAAAHQTSVKKRTRTILGAGAGALLAIGIAVAIAGQYAAVHVGGADDQYANISLDAPTIGKARSSNADELVDYTGPNAKRPPAGSRAVNPVGVGKPKMGTADSEGLQMGEADQDMINGVIAANKKTLFPCLKAIAKQGEAIKVPLEFALAETGKVTRVWVDNPDLKDSGLQECVFAELQKWPFKPGSSGTSVKLSFNVGK